MIIIIIVTGRIELRSVIIIIIIIIMLLKDVIKKSIDNVYHCYYCY